MKREVAGIGACVLLFVSQAMPVRGCVVRATEIESAGTVPFIFDDNRVFAELTFVRPDGALRKAVAFVDLGTPRMVIDQKLREELQPDQNKPLLLRVGNLEIPIASTAIETDTRLGFTGRDGKRTIPVETILPGSLLKNYQVVFDYAKRTLTIARPDTLEGKGYNVSCRVNEKTGLISVTGAIAEHSYAVAIDCGSAYSWIRHDVAQQWVKAHPDWERGTGAVGEANMQTRTDGAEARATILRLPEIRFGSLQLKQIGALGISAEAPPIPPAPGESAVHGDFFDWYSKKSPEPVIGWIGGNVLKGFRVMIDFPRRMIYWEQQIELDPHDLDQVGVTLERRDTGYFIAGIAQKDGKPTVDAVRVGDRLIQVGDLQLSNATRGAIFAALHGKPGSVRTLVVERDGKRLNVAAKTTAF
jgi:hypothetical protein